MRLCVWATIVITLAVAFPRVAQAQRTVMLIAAGSQQPVASFGADKHFSGGQALSIAPHQANIDTTAVSAAPPKRIYWTARTGSDFQYTLAPTFPVPCTSDALKVRLDFAELQDTQPGQRIFNIAVTANTTLTVPYFDIARTAGAPNKAVAVNFIVQEAKNCVITIHFKSVRGQALVNAIEVFDEGKYQGAQIRTEVPAARFDSNGKGGSLSASLGYPNVGTVSGLFGSYAAVNLTTEGTTDWANWGLSGVTAMVNKRGGGNEISNYTASAPASVVTSGIPFSWSDGSVSLSPSNPATINAVQTSTFARGFTLSVPADTATRTLRLYVGVHAAQATLVANLDDASAPAYQDGSVSNPGGTSYAVYTFTYHAASAGHKLVIGFFQNADYTGHGAGSLILQSATLQSVGDRSLPVAPEDNLTFHYNVARNGWDQNESTLNAANVAQSSFGQLPYSPLMVDGYVLAQPLYVSNYKLSDGSVHNLLIVATESDSVYVFDADSGIALGYRSLGTAGRTAPTYGPMPPAKFDPNPLNCQDIEPFDGISATPVADRSTGTLYVAAQSESAGGNWTFTLYALNFGDPHLTDRVPPQLISPIAMQFDPTTGKRTNQQILFDPQNQHSRAALLLVLGSVYVSLGSHCDNGATPAPNSPNVWTSGWVLAFDSSTLKPTGAFNTEPDEQGSSALYLGSPWMGGYGPAVDGAGNLLFATGNGNFSANSGGRDYGESTVKLDRSVPVDNAVLDYFTPHDWLCLNNGDADLGSGGLVSFDPYGNGFSFVAQMGKVGKLFLLDINNLGKYNSANDSGALQSLQVGNASSCGSWAGVWGGPAWYNGPAGQFLFYQPDGEPLQAVQVGFFGTPAMWVSTFANLQFESGYGGTQPVVSSWGQKPGTGIVWIVRHDNANGPLPLYLEAYDASNIQNRLFHQVVGSWYDPNVHQANNGFVTPVVANGKVFVGSEYQVAVFGLSTTSTPLPSASVSGITTPSPAALPSLPKGIQQFTGSVTAIEGSSVVLRLRTGQSIKIDVSNLQARRATGVIELHAVIRVSVLRGPDRVLRALAVGHAPHNPGEWPPDVP